MTTTTPATPPPAPDPHAAAIRAALHGLVSTAGAALLGAIALWFQDSSHVSALLAAIGIKGIAEGIIAGAIGSAASDYLKHRLQ